MAVLKGFIAVILSILVVFIAPAFGQVAQLPNTTIPTQCIDLNQDRICEAVVLANGTMINFTKLAPTPEKQSEGKCQGFQNTPKFCEFLLMPNGETVKNKTWTYGCTTGNHQVASVCVEDRPVSSPEPTFALGEPEKQTQTVEPETEETTTWTDPDTGLVYDIPTQGDYCLDFNEDAICDVDFTNGKMVVYDETDEEESIEEPAVGEYGNSDGESIEEDEAVGGTDSIEKEDEVPTMPDTSPTNDWMNACSTIQQFLYQSCDAYVNSDGTLTNEGDRAVVCIRNGAVLGGGGMIGGVPPSIAADILSGLAEMTGCGGIVDMQEVKQMVSLGRLTDLSALSRFLP